MGIPQTPPPVKLIVGFIFNSEALIERTEGILYKKFGELDYRSPLFEFNFTDYYEKEIGGGLKRRFISFKKLIPPEKIIEIKLFTNRIEARFKRKVNIDPGYITGANLILASTKNYSHRIYLERGIYAEVTLIFREGAFGHLPWTYPDYRTKGYRDCFNEIRKNYLADLRAVI